MIIVIEHETEVRLGVEEKLVALNILLVIYLHDKRYLEALEDIEELLIDSEMQIYREYLLLKQNEVRQALMSLLNLIIPCGLCHREKGKFENRRFSR